MHSILGYESLIINKYEITNDASVQRHDRKDPSILMTLPCLRGSADNFTELISPPPKPELVNSQRSTVRARNHKDPVTEDPQTHSALVPGQLQ